MYSRHTTTIAIIGGGVVGCSIAYYLQKAGIHVAVIERNEVAAEASGAAAGLLSPLGRISGPGPFTNLLLASWSRSPELILELETLTGVQVEHQQTGSLRIASSEDEVGLLRERMAVWQAMGIEVEWLARDKALQREPRLGPCVVAAAHIASENSVSAPAMTRAYADAADKLGAIFYEHTEVTGLLRSGTRVTGVRTAQGETIACDHLVIAAGAWSAHCSEWMGFGIPVTPLRGQMLSLRQPESPLQYVLSGDIYLIPKGDNTIFVGATAEQAGFDKSITAGGIAELLRIAFRLVPMLESLPIVNMWAGLRPLSPDGTPILGKAPGWENVTLATGHGRSGLQSSAITGQTIASLIITGQTPEIIRPFGIERFMG
jgi:glycine oxidase